jgi:hypothetical protein
MNRKWLIQWFQSERLCGTGCNDNDRKREERLEEKTRYIIPMLPAAVADGGQCSRQPTAQVGHYCM